MVQIVHALIITTLVTAPVLAAPLGRKHTGHKRAKATTPSTKPKGKFGGISSGAGAAFSGVTTAVAGAGLVTSLLPSNQDAAQIEQKTDAPVAAGTQGTATSSMTTPESALEPPEPATTTSAATPPLTSAPAAELNSTPKAREYWEQDDDDDEEVPMYRHSRFKAVAGAGKPPAAKPKPKPKGGSGVLDKALAGAGTAGSAVTAVTTGMALSGLVPPPEKEKPANAPPAAAAAAPPAPAPAPAEAQAPPPQARAYEDVSDDEEPPRQMSNDGVRRFQQRRGGGHRPRSSGGSVSSVWDVAIPTVAGAAGFGGAVAIQQTTRELSYDELN